MNFIKIFILFSIANLFACDNLTANESYDLRAELSSCIKSGRGVAICEQEARESRLKKINANECKSKMPKILDECATAGDINACINIKKSLNQCN
jgi:hypothetical protein